jgi:hypothetical protein
MSGAIEIELCDPYFCQLAVIIIFSVIIHECDQGKIHPERGYYVV